MKVTLSFFCFLCCAVSLATEAPKPTPPTPEQLARFRERFVETHRYRPGASTATHVTRLTEVLNQAGNTRLQNEISVVLDTYPLSELRRYFKELGESGIPPAGLRTLLESMKDRGSSACSEEPAAMSLRTYFCRHHTGLGNAPLRSNELHRLNGPETLQLSEKELALLDEDCKRVMAGRFACPKGRKAVSPLQNHFDESFGCTRDEDCVAIRNGCGLAKVFQSSSDVHHRFRCVCKRGPVVSGCFPEEGSNPSGSRRSN